MRLEEAEIYLMLMVERQGVSIQTRERCCWRGIAINNNRSSWFSAVDVHLDEDKTSEGTIGLRAVSDVIFEDEGAAIAWCISQ